MGKIKKINNSVLSELYIETQMHYHDVQQFVSEKPIYHNNALQIYGSKDDSDLSKVLLDKGQFPF